MGHRIVVDIDGTASWIHDDAVTALFRDGGVRITRASHVEPTDDGRWTADMSPSNGPVLGPFDTRREALDREVDWLRENLGL